MCIRDSLYYYFDGKHGLVAATYARDYAAILEEDRMVLREAMGTATDLDELMHHASVLLLDQSAPDRRKQRLAVLATAQVDPVVAEAIQEPNRFHHQQYIDAVEECRSRGWLDDSTDVHAMALLWMSLPFGLIFGDLDPTLSVNMGALFASANAVRAIPQLDER